MFVVAVAGGGRDDGDVTNNHDCLYDADEKNLFSFLVRIVFVNVKGIYNFRTMYVKQKIDKTGQKNSMEIGFNFILCVLDIGIKT